MITTTSTLMQADKIGFNNGPADQR